MATHKTILIRCLAPVRYGYPYGTEGHEGHLDKDGMQVLDTVDWEADSTHELPDSERELVDALIENGSAIEVTKSGDPVSE